MTLTVEEVVAALRDGTPRLIGDAPTRIRVTAADLPLGGIGVSIEMSVQGKMMSAVLTVDHANRVAEILLRVAAKVQLEEDQPKQVSLTSLAEERD